MRTYHRDALSILEAVPRLWARLRGKCFNCGNNARFWRGVHGKGCSSCFRDLAWCHWCNKGRALMAAYGASPERLNCRCFVQVPDDFGRRIEKEK